MYILLGSSVWNIPLINPQRGIFRPKQMDYLSFIKTVKAENAVGSEANVADARQVHSSLCKLRVVLFREMRTAFRLPAVSAEYRACWTYSREEAS
jgi:hypothetical protein